MAFEEKLWTISNALSISRIVLMVPIVMLLFSAIPYHREYAVLVMLLALATDALDGYFARRLNQVSDIGKIIDPLADKISVGVVIILLTLFGDVQLWYTAMVICRDVLIFSGGMYIRKRTGKVLSSNIYGKITVVLIALTIIFALLRYPVFYDIFSVAKWSSVAMMVLSFASYVQRFFSVVSTDTKLLRYKDTKTQKII
ncbi:MAG: CDP-alcohol phosphatidyltransferase family protein [Bacteroidota bacterium]|nr:CDP-alcohol phosphatidyltransferase family protein [Bacteroidota bacterium]